MKVATQPQITLESVTRHLSQNIQGDEITFEDLAFKGISDINRVKKTYKISPPPARKASKQVNGEPDQSNDQTQILEVQILGAMALRGAT